MTNADALKKAADALNIPLRTKDQVADTLHKAEAYGGHLRVANMMLTHGRLTDDAIQYVQDYLK